MFSLALLDSFTLPLAAAEFWMSRWLTPIWMLGTGVALGLFVLLILLAVFFVLSKIPFFEQLPRERILPHGLALLGGAGIGMGLYSLLFPAEAGSVEIQWDERLLSVGALFVLSSLLTYSLVFCSNRRFLGEVKSILFEGIGGYLLTVAASIAVAGLLCTFVADEPTEILKSIPQLFKTGESTIEVVVKGVSQESEENAFVPVDVPYDPQLLDRVEITSNRNVILSDAPNIASFQIDPVTVVANEPFQWSKKQKGEAPIPMYMGGQIHVQNKEVDDATILFKLRTLPAVPEVASLLIAAAMVTVFGLMFFLQQGAAPKASAVALAAAKSEVGQPLFLILLLIGAVSILFGVFLPFYTFGEDIKLLKDCGITLILVLALFQGIWSASSSVSEEIEGRTALTVLSKPVGRRSFLIGKILGVFWLLLLMFIILGSAELLAVAYKPLYDARENSLETPLWQACHLEMARTVPGLAMGLFHSVTLSAFSVAFATRIPQLANFALCFAIYLVGHLTQAVVSSAEGGFAILQFIGQLIAVIVPDLEHFSMQAAIDSGNPIPMSYLAGTLVYALLYTSIAVLLGLLLFEDRDLA